MAGTKVSTKKVFIELRVEADFSADLDLEYAMMDSESKRVFMQLLRKLGTDALGVLIKEMLPVAAFKKGGGAEALNAGISNVDVKVGKVGVV